MKKNKDGGVFWFRMWEGQCEEGERIYAKLNAI